MCLPCPRSFSLPPCMGTCIHPNPRLPGEVRSRPERIATICRAPRSQMPDETSSSATAATGSTAARRRLAELLRSCGSVVALTGAGVSVPSGIPDFRSPGTGLWERVNPMEVAHIDVFRADPERFWRFYGERFASLGAKEPNAAHHALVELERRGLLSA